MAALTLARPRPGAIPLWAQIRDTIATAIDDGRLAPDERLPGEAELAALLGVGRPTVRQALTALRREGRIHTRKGAGTFVARHNPSIGLLGFEGLTSLLAARGLRATSRVLATRTDSEPPFEHLRRDPSGAGGSAGWFVVERLRSLRQGSTHSPFCVETDAFCLEACPDAEARFAQTGSATAVLEDGCGFTLGSADVATTAIAARGEVARLLAVRSGTPVLRMERRNRTPAGGVVHGAVFVVRTDLVPIEESLIRTAH